MHLSIFNEHTASTIRSHSPIYFHGAAGNDKSLQPDFQRKESDLITPCTSENGFGSTNGPASRGCQLCAGLSSTLIKRPSDCISDVCTEGLLNT